MVDVRRNTFRVLLNVLVCSWLLLLSPPARADDLEQAKALTQKAVSFYQAGRYIQAIEPAEEALAIFEKIYGPDHPLVSTGLSNLAQIYAGAGKYDQSEAMLKRALEIDEKAFGPDHPETASALSNLAVHYFDVGKFDSAEPLFERALKIQQKIDGPDNPDLATSLNNLASLHETQGQYALAEPFFKQALAIREKVFGPDHPNTATVLNNLAGLYESMGRYQESDDLYRRVLGIREATLGPNHPLTANTLNDLGLLYSDMGRSEEALSQLHRALEIRENTLGTRHPEVAATLTNLAAVYVDIGNYPEAESFYRQALKIRQEAFGPLNRDVAQAHNNLGYLFDTIGDWRQAEAQYREALDIWEKVLPPDHPDIAAVSNNLAELYKAMGDYERARPLYDRSLAIRLKLFGPTHPAVAVGLNNLAGLYDDMGEWRQAEDLYRKALANVSDTLGPDSSMAAAVMSNLGSLLSRHDQLAEAESLYRKALAIRLDTFGKEHPSVALSLNNLGSLYMYENDYPKALDRFTQALATEKTAVGSHHPNISHLHINMALAHALLKEYEAANRSFRLALDVDARLIDSVMGFTSEDRQLIFLALKKQGIMAYLSLVTQYLADHSTARLDAFNIWIRRKGIIFEAQRRFQEALAYSENAKIQRMFFELTRIRTQLSKLAFQKPGVGGDEALREKIDTLEKQKDELENQMAALSQTFARQKKYQKADAYALAQALPDNSALVEFARLDFYNYTSTEPASSWLPPHYIAFVLLDGQGNDVALVDLGSADEIDQIIADHKRASRDLTAEGYRQTLEAAGNLYHRVFAPIQKHLGSIRTVFLSPDGNLSLIPFEVLVGPDGRYLVEDYIFNYLPAGRDLLNFDSSGLKSSDQALLLGDPDYDLNLPVNSPWQTTGRSETMRSIHFSPLPGTREEVMAIHEMLDTSKVYTGDQALEKVLEQARSPKIVHLATHGFFLQDLDLTSLMGEKSQVRDLVFDPGQHRLEHFDNPLLRSGLALAGANHSLAAADPALSDGILTAEKVLGLHLQGTELVVLSACQTGLGEVKAGEGIYGLRRTFLQAGAKSLVMSMWPVPDRETKELMVAFYKNYLSAQTDKVQSLRQALLQVKKTAETRYGHPFPIYWGGFVFLGQP